MWSLLRVDSAFYKAKIKDIKVRAYILVLECNGDVILCDIYSHRPTTDSERVVRELNRGNPIEKYKEMYFYPDGRLEKVEIEQVCL